MSAIVGTRDKRLQASAERFSTTADGKAILMSGATPVFRVDSSGAGSPASIAITAKPLNVVGDIVFSVSAGTTLVIDGNVATVNFEGMTTDTVTVQARIREFGVDYIANYIISKVFDGVAGDTGLAGINTAQAFAYKRAAAVPTDSPGDVVYTFASAAITAPAGNDLANGWSKNIPAGTAPLYVRVAGASSRNATDNIAANEWAAAVLLARDGAAGADGAPGAAGVAGADGMNTAQAFAYKRAAVAPVDSPGDVVYTFATAAISTPAGNGLANGWSKTIPAGTAPLYVRVAAASSRSATDAIAGNEWTAAVLLAQDGTAGQNGLNVAPVRIYQRAVANVAPALPSAACTFTFATGVLTGLNNGWSTQVPTAGGAYLFTSGATAASTAATDDIPAVEWAAAARMAADGANGSNGANGVDGLNVAPVRIYQRGATNIAPALPSTACTFTFATGALTGLNNGWSTQVPTAGGAYLFTSGATAASRGATDDIPASEWSAAARLAADGVTTYTWVKYGNTAAGGGFSDSPVGMTYIGLAYNKATLVESDNPADYAWSLIKGGDGAKGEAGADGKTTYTWIKYADNADGTGLYDSPRDSTLYLGLAVNKLSAAPSTNKADYAWAKFRGGQGVAGPSGQRGTVTVTAPGYSTWSDASAVYELGHAGYGAPINRDMVTLYDATYAVTKFYVDGEWLAADTVLNGGLLVNGTVAAKALAVDELSAITSILGKVKAGDISASTIHGGPGYPTPAYAWPMGAGGGKGFHLSEKGILFGDYNGGVPGAQYFSAGANGQIDAPGLSIKDGNAIFSGRLSAASGSFSGTLTGRNVTAENLATDMALIGTVIRSRTYNPGSYGWMINADGTAEFSVLSITGRPTGPVYGYSWMEATSVTLATLGSATGIAAAHKVILRAEGDMSSAAAAGSIITITLYRGTAAGAETTFMFTRTVRASTTGGGVWTDEVLYFSETFEVAVATDAGRTGSGVFFKAIATRAGSSTSGTNASITLSTNIKNPTV
ncbi:hypothetical protein CLU93_3719 [Janthinobacterium sp. 35]|uniref:hypothetical protein n=1 Tax=Janthinobacterium sp. 35 TaxID=2035210 RepID=UPI000C19F59E|nr:hypothetical protein [Janthinobacterium sp. 35]PIG29411.1 hypothetical protein CLU93_3719 [Janthinobacterium sp. 35]